MHLGTFFPPRREPGDGIRTDAGEFSFRLLLQPALMESPGRYSGQDLIDDFSVHVG